MLEYLYLLLPERARRGNGKLILNTSETESDSYMDVLRCAIQLLDVYICPKGFQL